MGLYYTLYTQKDNRGMISFWPHNIHDCIKFVEGDFSFKIRYIIKCSWFAQMHIAIVFGTLYQD